MRFSWLALLLAPLPVPLLIAVAVGCTGMFGPGPGKAFSDGLLVSAILLIPGGLISYGTTACAFLPCLWLASRRWRLTLFRVVTLGSGLGFAVLVPTIWVAWKSSGPDSGPPVDSFLTSFLDTVEDPAFWVFGMICPLAGAFTAGLYWWLAGWRLKRARPVPAGHREGPRV